MDMQITMPTVLGEDVIKQKFWIPLCLSINVHVTIAVFVGLS